MNELKNDWITNLSTSAWELKSASNIQEKIFNQISLAKLRLEKINSEIFQLERKFIEHEIRKSRSEEKSKQIKKFLSIENENKADAEIQGINKVKINWPKWWHQYCKTKLLYNKRLKMVAVGSKSIPEKQSISLDLSKETEDNLSTELFSEIFSSKPLTMTLFQRKKLKKTMIKLNLTEPRIIKKF